MIYKAVMKNIHERAGFFRVLRRRTLTLSALLFFMISCGADAASVTDYAEEELFADALINLSSRLSFLEELQLVLWSTCAVFMLRTIRRMHGCLRRIPKTEVRKKPGQGVGWCREKIPRTGIRSPRTGTPSLRTGIHPQSLYWMIR